MFLSCPPISKRYGSVKSEQCLKMTIVYIRRSYIQLPLISELNGDEYTKPKVVLQMKTVTWRWWHRFVHRVY